MMAQRIIVKRSYSFVLQASYMAVLLGCMCTHACPHRRAYVRRCVRQRETSSTGTDAGLADQLGHLNFNFD